jgi:hypothetical protein
LLLFEFFSSFSFQHNPLQQNIDHVRADFKSFNGSFKNHAIDCMNEAEKSHRSPKSGGNWQVNLLPFMTKTIIFLSCFFFLASLAQVIYLHSVIRQDPPLDIKSSLDGLMLPANASTKDIMEATRLKALVNLEANSFQNQYHQANVLLMARLWTSYIGFVTGMILAVVGATFLLGKLREPLSEFSSAIAGNNMSLKTTSPGLILAVLGTSLMLTTLLTHHNIETKQVAIYIHDQYEPTGNSQAHSLPAHPPPLPDPVIKDSPFQPIK